MRLLPVRDADIRRALRDLDQGGRHVAADGSYEHPGLLSRLWPYLDMLGCRTMLVEDDVLDEEYFREYLTFYATTFVEHPPVATRLHFFGAEADVVCRALDPLSGPLSDMDRDEVEYLGYVVLRPSSPSTVGETETRRPARGH